jgi:hypothetical protein
VARPVSRAASPYPSPVSVPSRRSMMKLAPAATALAVDEGPHNMDGLLLHGWDGPQRVEAFTSRRVMDSWVDPREPDGGRRSLLRVQYNALGKFNLAAIERIVVSKYRRGAAFNRQHPFVDILLSDITESEEAASAAGTSSSNLSR